MSVRLLVDIAACAAIVALVFTCERWSNFAKQAHEERIESSGALALCENTILQIRHSQARKHNDEPLELFDTKLRMTEVLADLQKCQARRDACEMPAGMKTNITNTTTSTLRKGKSSAAR